MVLFSLFITETAMETSLFPRRFLPVYFCIFEGAELLLIRNSAVYLKGYANSLKIAPHRHKTPAFGSPGP